MHRRRAVSQRPVLVSSVSTQGGFAIIEALVALLVVAFGMLAIASFQFTLSRASDVAKQRTEATRIAQREVDRLRSFGQRQSDGNLTDARYSYVDDVVSTSTAQTVTGLTTNTTYQISRQVRTAANMPVSAASSPSLTPSLDRMRFVTVIVSWIDRIGQPQDVRLQTAISDGDPGDLGALGVARRAASTLRPKNRNINVPYPAVNIAACPSGVAGGCSAFVAPPGNVAYVFTNDTGNVVQQCTLATYTIATLSRPADPNNTVSGTTSATHPFAAGTWVAVAGVEPAGYNGSFRLATGSGTSFSYMVPDSSLPNATLTGTSVIRRALFEGMDLGNLSGVSCGAAYTTQAYLVSGSVRFVDRNNPSADDLINPSGPTYDLLSSDPLTITTTSGHAPTSTSCTAQRQRVLGRPNVRAEEIQNYSRSDNLVTITTRNSHAFEVGMVVVTSSVPGRQLPDPNLQGRFEITSTPSSTTFTYVDVGPNVTYTDTSGQVELLQQITIAATDRVPPGYNDNSPISTFVAYTCVVAPSTTGTQREWWGRLNLVPETSSSNGRVPWPGNSVSSPFGSWQVCRYSADYNGNGLTNSDHPRYYRQVTSSLDSQNFAVIRGTCPTDTQPTYTGNRPGDFYNTSSVAHQPGTGSASPGEPASDGTAIPMQ
jgi:type IV pilus modification protein PilV